MSIISWYEQSKLIGPILAIITIIGLPLSIFFFLKSIKLKKPIWGTTSNNYFTNEHDTKIKVLYNNNEVPQLTETKIYFWNNGKDIINNSDINTIDHIRVIINEPYTILDAICYKCSDQAINLRLTRSDDDKNVLIDFDYLSYKDGFLIKIYHTGKSGSDIEINGTVKGLKKIKKYRHSVNLSLSMSFIPFTSKLKTKIRYYINLPFLLIFPLFPLITDGIKLHSIQKGSIAFSIIFGLFYWSIALILIRNRPPNSIVEDRE